MILCYYIYIILFSHSVLPVLYYNSICFSFSIACLRSDSLFYRCSQYCFRTRVMVFILVLDVSFVIFCEMLIIFLFFQNMDMAVLVPEVAVDVDLLWCFSALGFVYPYSYFTIVFYSCSFIF